MFSYIQNSLCCEAVPLADIARDAGTPCYVYSSGAILQAYREYDRAFEEAPHLICYAVKANSNLAVLSLLARAGAGFDIVSAGELYRVLRAGGDPARVIFSGVGKTADEINFALENRIHAFNCESEGELDLLNSLAALKNVRADFAIRVNPDVDAATHPYISTGLKDHKFGIAMQEAEAVYDRGRRLGCLNASGVSCHIGSQLMETGPILESVEKVLAFIRRLRTHGHPIRRVDLGGGLGVAYRPGEQSPAIRTLVSEIRRMLAGTDLITGLSMDLSMDLSVALEPGRSIVGPAGVLLTRVLYRKKSPSKEFVVIDAAMNDLIRPALYQSHHEILPLQRNTAGTVLADVVGPVCESGDFLARDREIANVTPGDYLAVCTAGAYGFTQASNYNSRPRPAEVLVQGNRWRIVRKRETFDDLVNGEELPVSPSSR